MTEATNAVPNPGSPEAVAKGCTCPVLDNGHGRGYMGQPGIFVCTDGCPVHGSLDDDDGQPSEQQEWHDFDPDC